MPNSNPDPALETDSQPPEPEVYHYTATIENYELIHAGLNRAGGYLGATKQDDDGTDLPEAEWVWTRSSGPTTSAIPDPDDIPVVDGMAILSIPSKRIGGYRSVIAPVHAAGLINTITADEMAVLREHSAPRDTVTDKPSDRDLLAAFDIATA